MARVKAHGLMPNAAAREAIKNIDLSVRAAIGESVRSGVLTPQQAEQRAREMRIKAVDALFRVIERHGELSKGNV